MDELLDEFVKKQNEVAAEDMKPEPKEIWEDFDAELFSKAPARKTLEPEPMVEEESNNMGMCPYAPRACGKVNTSRCDKKCDHNPDHYMDKKIKEVFDKEPWSNYCFTCGEFVPSRRHEDMLEPQELIGSHTVATGYNEYRVKLSKWTLERLTGKKLLEDPPVDWKNTL